MNNDIVLTGLRANGEFTLGNYLGGIKPIIDLANNNQQYQINMFLPDLHTITVDVDYQKLQAQILRCLKEYLAAGLNIENENIYVYRQSYIPAHSELAWILQCFTGFGEASRMVEFKDKSTQIGEDRVSLGLFNYPVLMAADILLYGAKWVPVGEDQRQHIELTRTLAQRLNNKFGKLFVVPEETKNQAIFSGLENPLRIRSLRNPDKKMSKSINDPSGTILLSDEPSEASKKVMSATTDSIGKINFNWSTQPGITNLLQILSLLSGKSQDEVNTHWVGKSSYGDLKKAVADAVAIFLSGLQERYLSIDDNALMQKLESSEVYMNEVANRQLHKVQKAIGLRPN
ncbi:tryptophan--tRNA ligase [Candidatus Saccharibacteria bacterium]|jgi:tryptophanyl-tRNA synthetase|nr:tryptophan--tRNA ligase [Candidatus Saccharibacteria bacterium]MBP7834492.1 tryptophan--tRNA ligase [Candidatus Saccharibacteria bacterium]